MWGRARQAIWGRTAQKAVVPPTVPSERDALIDFLRINRFDGAAYVRYYSDLAALDADAALRHFADHGFAEGRHAVLGLPLAQMQALRLTQWTEGWQADIARRATGAALWSHDPSGIDLMRFADLLAPSPDHVPAIMIGDSHTAFLTQAPAMLSSGLLPVPMICSGGSARGLHNPNSRAQFRTYILNRLSRLGLMILHRPVVLKFGQVDVEFLFDLKRVRDGDIDYAPAAMRQFIDETVDRYASFIADCRTVCSGRLIVMAIFPPTLGDATVRAGYVNAHIAFLNQEDDVDQLRAALGALDHPDLAERTMLARYWNARLAEACERMAIPFVEEFDALLGEDGVVHAELADPQDHHLQLQSPRAQSRIAAVGARLRELALVLAGYILSSPEWIAPLAIA